MAETVGLVSEVQEDGSTEVTETSMPSNYDVSVRRLDGTMPEAPSMELLSQLFEPRYELTVHINGHEVPFVYKKVDPGTMLLTHGTPLTVDTDAGSISERLSELAPKEGEEQDPESIAEMQELLQKEETVKMLEMMENIKKKTIQAAVIQPVITDDLYGRIDPKILTDLYDAITGGVVADNEAVQHFRGSSETEKA